MAKANGFYSGLIHSLHPNSVKIHSVITCNPADRPTNWPTNQLKQVKHNLLGGSNKVFVWFKHYEVLTKLCWQNTRHTLSCNPKARYIILPTSQDSTVSSDKNRNRIQKVFFGHCIFFRLRLRSQFTLVFIISNEHLCLFGLSPDSIKGSFFPVDVICVWLTISVFSFSQLFILLISFVCLPENKLKVLPKSALSLQCASPFHWIKIKHYLHNYVDI